MLNTNYIPNNISSTPPILGLHEPVKLTLEQLDSFISDNSYRDEVNSRWNCNICSKSSSIKFDITRHIEAKHVSLPELICEICMRPSKTRDSLRRHITKYHNNVSTQFH